MPIDLARMGSEDEPPPRGAYWLLDRALAESGQDIQREQIPRVARPGFSVRQANRPAGAARTDRLSHRAGRRPSARSPSEIGGDALGAAGEEKVPTARAGRAAHVEMELAAAGRDARRRRGMALVDAEAPRRAARPLARDAAKDIWRQDRAARWLPTRRMRIKLLAAILLVEMSVDQPTARFRFQRTARPSSACPLAEPIDPQHVCGAELAAGADGAASTSRRLSDEQLVDLYRRADALSPHGRLAKAGPRSRWRGRSSTSSKARSDRQGRGLRHAGADRARHRPRRSTIWTRPGRRPRRARRRPRPGTWPSWALRIARGEVAEADRLLAAHSQRAHSRAGRGPGVDANAGRCGHHRSRRQADSAAAERNREAPGIVVPGAAAEPGKIWTPGSDQPSGTRSRHCGRRATDNRFGAAPNQA